MKALIMVWKVKWKLESIHISNNAESKDGIEGLTAFIEKESLTLMNKNLYCSIKKDSIRR